MQYNKKFNLYSHIPPLYPFSYSHKFKPYMFPGNNLYLTTKYYFANILAPCFFKNASK